MADVTIFRSKNLTIILIRTFFDITVGICNIDTFKFIRILTSTLELRIETVCQEFSIWAKELRVDNSCVEVSFRCVVIRIVATIITVAINFKPACLEGTIIARKHGGINETITVRRISYGVGCEKVFPVHAPNVVNVETVRHGKVRRAKLYYLRDRMGKAAKVKEKV